MLFSQYLIEEKLIQKSQLLEAVQYQFQRSKSMFEILKSSDILSEDQLTALVFEIQEKGLSDVSVIQNFKELSQEQKQQIKKSFENSKVTLGRALVELKHLEISTYEKAAYAFRNRSGSDNSLGQIEQKDQPTEETSNPPPSTPPETKPEAVQEEQAVSAKKPEPEVTPSLEPEVQEEFVGIEPAALDSLKEQIEAGVLDESILDEFRVKKNETEQKAEDTSKKVAETKATAETSKIQPAALEEVKKLVQEGSLEKNALTELIEDNNLPQDETDEQSQSNEAPRDLTEFDIDYHKLEGNQIDESFLDEFLKSFSAKSIATTFQKIKKLEDLLKKASSEKSNLQLEILADFRVIKGLARLINARLMEEITIRVEILLSDCNDQHKIEVIISLFDIIIQLKNSLEINKSEQQFLGDIQKRSEIDTILAKIRN